MSDNDIQNVKIDVNGLKKDVRSLEIRMEKQDTLNETMRDLVTSVQLMAQNMNNMIEEQKEQKEILQQQDDRLQQIELKPAQQWNSMTKTIFNTVIGAVAGGACTLIGIWVSNILN